MDYGDIFRRSWNIIWKNKFMLFLGFLAALGSGGSYNGSGGNSGSNFNFGSGDFPEGMPFDPNLIEQFGSRMQEFWIAFGVLILGLICVAFIVGIILWLVRLTAQAGMIDAASRLDAGEEVTFGAAISAGAPPHGYGRFRPGHCCYFHRVWNCYGAFGHVDGRCGRFFCV